MIKEKCKKYLVVWVLCFYICSIMLRFNVILFTFCLYLQAGKVCHYFLIMINNEQAICVKTETDIPERPPPEYVVLSEFLDPVFKILHTSFRNAILAQNY